MAGYRAGTLDYRRGYFSTSQGSYGKVFLVLTESMKMLSCRQPYAALQATGQGLEPQLTGPKPAVLPLDDPVIY